MLGGWSTKLVSMITGNDTAMTLFRTLLICLQDVALLAVYKVLERTRSGTKARNTNVVSDSANDRDANKHRENGGRSGGLCCGGNTSERSPSSFWVPYAMVWWAGVEDRSSGLSIAHPTGHATVECIDYPFSVANHRSRSCLMT
jgi:hypothetical protein